MRGNRFYKILEGKNLTDSFYKIISIELEENQLKEFQEFLVSIIDDVIKNIGEYPPIQEEGLVNKKTISELGETPFRSGAICYIPIKCEDIFYVVGDIHGDINSFKAFLDNIQFFNNSKKNIKSYISRATFMAKVFLVVWSRFCYVCFFNFFVLAEYGRFYYGVYIFADNNFDLCRIAL